MGEIEFKAERLSLAEWLRGLLDQTVPCEIGAGFQP
mgnify:CR=1 FL=1|tara:strand:+ start:344 stop:451 length:108 start_codon:yes stop_codon:yes gene_type:complete